MAVHAPTYEVVAGALAEFRARGRDDRHHVRRAAKNVARLPKAA